MENTKVVVDGLQGSVSLILDKLDALIHVTAGQVTAYYPYVVRQKIIDGVTCIFVLMLGIVIFISSMIIGKYLTKKYEGIDIWDCNSFLIPFIIGSLITVVSFTTMCLFGLPMMLNPHYYAVKDIIEIGKGLIK